MIGSQAGALGAIVHCDVEWERKRGPDRDRGVTAGGGTPANRHRLSPGSVDSRMEAVTSQHKTVTSRRVAVPVS